jgi:hypothetical protein
VGSEQLYYIFWDRSWRRREPRQLRIIKFVEAWMERLWIEMIKGSGCSCSGCTYLCLADESLVGTLTVDDANSRATPIILIDGEDFGRTEIVVVLWIQWLAFLGARGGSWWCWLAVSVISAQCFSWTAFYALSMPTVWCFWKRQYNGQMFVLFEKRRELVLVLLGKELEIHICLKLTWNSLHWGVFLSFFCFNK